MDGYICVNKPAGMTSHDVVFKLRRILNQKKIGHTGTLDPDTTGVLAIALGKATKSINFLEEKKKEYICTIRVGVSTDTEDISGTVLKTEIVKDLDLQDVKNAVNELLNLKEQIPPMYSAVKVNGKKLYEYARQGLVIERKPRPISVFDVELLSDITYDNDNALFTFRILASKGIYIRTICVSLGEILGHAATMESLVRTRSGNFRIDNSYTLEEIKAGNYKLISVLDALEIDKIEVSKSDIEDLGNGKKLFNRYPHNTENFCLLVDGELKAIYQTDKDESYIKCVRGFQN